MPDFPYIFKFEKLSLWPFNGQWVSGIVVLFIQKESIKEANGITHCIGYDLWHYWE